MNRAISTPTKKLVHRFSSSQAQSSKLLNETSTHDRSRMQSPVVKSLKTERYYQEAMYIDEMIRIVKSKNFEEYQGQVIDLPNINHWAYQLKLPKSGFYMLVSMQNEQLEDDEVKPAEAKVDEYGNFTENFTLPSIEEFISDPDQYSGHLHKSQQEKIQEKNTKFKQKGSPKGNAKSPRDSLKTKKEKYNHVTELTFGLTKEVIFAK